VALHELGIDATSETASLAFELALPNGIAQALEIRVAMIWPLKTRGDLLGVLLVEHTPLLGRRLSILNGIAQQLAMAMENARLSREVAAQQRLERELELGRDIQASFLPDACPTFPNWEVCSYWHLARQVGGDFYDFIPLPRDHYGVVVADVADKGVPAALFMAVSRTLTRAAAITGHRTPGEVLTKTNDMILSDARSDLFVTMAYADLSPVGRVVYANAGHNPPLLVRAATGELERLVSHGMALGVMPEVVIGDQHVRLENGDLLVLYTDGVTDALDARGQEFGMARLEQTIVAHRSGSANQIVAALQAALHEFVGDEPPFDDLTVVVAKRVVES
jgi:sigma-B regulation protein RsbU (phosphoserine phosphatase)